MTDRLAEIVLGLQRLAEHARLTGDDLRHIQLQERRRHAEWLEHQLSMVREVYRVLENERYKFKEEEQPQQQELPKPRAVDKATGTTVKAVG